MVKLSFQSDTARAFTRAEWSGVPGDSATVTRKGFLTQQHKVESLEDLCGALAKAVTTMMKDPNRPKGTKKAAPVDPNAPKRQPGRPKALQALPAKAE